MQPGTINNLARSYNRLTPHATNYCDLRAPYPGGYAGRARQASVTGVRRAGRDAADDPSGDARRPRSRDRVATQAPSAVTRFGGRSLWARRLRSSRVIAAVPSFPVRGRSMESCVSLPLEAANGGLVWRKSPGLASPMKVSVDDTPGGLAWGLLHGPPEVDRIARPTAVDSIRCSSV